MVPSAKALQRIRRDVSQVMGPSKSSLSAQGVYYIPDDSLVYEGTALLVGQKDTPYFGGYYFFKLTFPEDYPFSPIKVRTLTQDGRTRFNPNMYIDGKVCLSILNTWHDGPQWTGVQSLESVLLVIMSDVLNANPLENEPAFRNCGPSEEAQAYNRLLWYANLQTSLYNLLTRPPLHAQPFHEILWSEFETNKAEIFRRTADASVYDGKTEVCRFFSMKATYNFTEILQKLKDVKN